MKLGVVDNMGIAVGIAAPLFAVQKLFPLPVLLAAILNFGSLPSSTSVSSVESKSGVVENLGTAYGITLQTTAVQK